MRSLTVALLFVISAAPAAAAKSYLAERFDSHIRVLSGGAIEVTETVVFRFEGSSFEHVFREIPTRRTDGVEVVRATMDGRVLPFGGRPGEVEVRGGSPVKVRWRFAPRSDSTHEFTLTYIVRGVVRKEPLNDVLEWTALPSKHDYAIGTSSVVFEFTATPEGRPRVDVQRVGEHSVEPSTARLQIVARNIRKDGWVKARLDFGGTTLIAAAPRWQQRQTRADALAPQWWIAAGAIVAAGVVLLFGLRQRYDAPPRMDSGSRTHQEPPDSLRPALAGALASNGSVTLQHAMATLFALADRGVIVVEEEPRRWGQRHFTVHRRRLGTPLGPEEAALLDLAFPAGTHGDAAPLAKVRSKVASGMRRYRDRVQDELRAMGLFDDDRNRVRRMFLGWGLSLLFLALAAIVPAAIMTRSFGGWPFLVPGAIALVAVAALIGQGALTPLSNEGVRHGSEWRAYARHLKEVARDRAVLTNSTPTALLSIAVALGLSGYWSKMIKQRRASAPSWFHTLSSDDGAFPAFVAVGGSGDAGHGGGGGAGGGAGGGSSGAG